MITLLAILIVIAVPVLIWKTAERFDSRYQNGMKMNVKRIGR